MRIAIAVNRTHAGKQPDPTPPGWWSQYNGGFTNEALSPAELAAAIRAGFGFTPQHKDYRRADNFLQGQHIALDLDALPAGTTLHDILEGDRFIGTYAGLLYTTPSSRPEAPRARVVFFLDRPIAHADKYGTLAAALVARYGEADQTCKDPARLFFGSPGCEYVLTDRVLTLETAAKVLVQPYLDNLRRIVTQGPRHVAPAADVSAETLAKHSESLLERIRTAAEGEKHYTLRDISRTFGGFVAGGYYDEAEARRWLQAAIETRRATVKDMRLAYRTIDEALAYGKLAPLYFDSPRPRRVAVDGRPDWRQEVIAERLAALERAIEGLEPIDPAYRVAVAEYYHLNSLEPAGV